MTCQSEASPIVFLVLGAWNLGSTQGAGLCQVDSRCVVTAHLQLSCLMWVPG